MNKPPTHVVLFEDRGWRDLSPLTAARAVFELRCGIDSLADKVRGALPANSSPPLVCVRTALRDVVAERGWKAGSSAEASLWMNGRLLCRRLPDLPCPGACWVGDTLVAAHLPGETAAKLTPSMLMENDASALRTLLRDATSVAFDAAWGRLIRYPWDLIAENAAELRRQIDALLQPGAAAVQAGNAVQMRNAGAYLIHPERIRIGPDTVIKPTAVLDASDGPIHIGAGVTISSHVSVRGPCSIGDGSLIQPGASIREGTSIGPVCKIGGEVEGTIIHGYANKQHDGFLGHSYVGEWVNLGADTVTSDLKNTYGNVSVPLHGGPPMDTGLRFVGSIIGDHTKTAICTRLNTGTVLGFSCQIAAGRPPRFVPDFTWLTDDGAVAYDVEKAIATARTVMARRKVTLTPAMEQVFRSNAAAATGATGTS